MNSPKVDTCAWESNWGLYDCEADALLHDYDHHICLTMNRVRVNESLIRKFFNPLSKQCLVLTTLKQKKKKKEKKKKSGKKRKF